LVQGERIRVLQRKVSRLHGQGNGAGGGPTHPLRVVRGHGQNQGLPHVSFLRGDGVGPSAVVAFLVFTG
jgi:hypothetical protein